MNCLQVRDRLLGDPNCDDQAVSAHLQTCSSCSEFARTLQVRDQKLKQAFAVQAPHKLAERIILQSSLSRQPWWQNRLVAAILVGVIGAFSFFNLAIDRTPNWSAIALDHVLEEPAALLANDTIAIDRLEARLNEFGLKAVSQFRGITYLDTCDMPGGKGLHVVLSTPNDQKVSLIIPPAGEPIDSSQSSRSGMNATIFHIGGTAVGVVVDSADKMLQVRQWIQQGLSAT